MKNSKIYLIFIFCIVVCTYSCKNNTKNYDTSYLYTFDEFKKVGFPVNDSSFGYVDYDNFDYAYIDSIETLIVYHMPGKLSFYDINKGEKYHEIKGFLGHLETLESFKYINKDSIILICKTSNWNRENDILPVNELAKIYLVNYEGQKLKDYIFDIDELINYNKDSISISKIFPFTTNLRVNMIGNKIFLLAHTAGQSVLGGKEYNEPVICCYDLETEELMVSNSIHHPYLKEEVFYPGSYNSIQNCATSKGFPVMRFFYSSDVFEWDYKNDKAIKHNVKSRLLDTIMAFPDQYCHHENLDGCYDIVLYNSYQKLYYFGFWLSSRLSGDNSISTCIVTDENFNFITEIIKPRIFEHSVFYNEDAVVCWTLNDSIFVSYSKMQKTNISFEKQIDSIKNVIKTNKDSYKKQIEKYLKGETKNSLINYLKTNKEVKDSNYCVFTVFAQSGCPSCREYPLKIINENIPIFNLVPLYLLITGENNNMVNKELSGMQLKELKNILLDTVGIVNNLPFQTSIKNPRLTIVKNNKVVLDSIYGNFDIETKLLPTLFENLGLKVILEEKFLSIK
ncbi:MAG: hypothetical protein LBV69_02090 [Bacteroidales bacterium]|jgi:hypothetical protein|nr:hypothetical protein [Bacteroidales bacterium]